MQQSYRPQSGNNFKGICKYCSFSAFCFLTCSGGILSSNVCGMIAFVPPETSGFVLMGWLLKPGILKDRGGGFMLVLQYVHRIMES